MRYCALTLFRRHKKGAPQTINLIWGAPFNLNIYSVAIKLLANGLDQALLNRTV